MRWRAALAGFGALLCIAGQAGAQATSKWALQIRNPVASERGELRLDPAAGRILLESSDTAWISLTNLQVREGRITFALPKQGRRFEGTVTGEAMQGIVFEPDGRVTQWQAQRIPDGMVRWPVRPRVRVRQLVLGTGPTTVVLPSEWRTLLPTAATLAAERDSLARGAGLQPPTRDGMVNAQNVALGLDPQTRAALRLVMMHIAGAHHDDASFLKLFGTATRLRLDLHQVAFELASAKRGVRQVAPEVLARGLGVFSRGMPIALDSLSLYGAAWRAWSRARTDTTESQMLLDALALSDPESFAAVRAIFAGYDGAADWWVDAVSWLLNAPWIETPTGTTSALELVRRFWGKGQLRWPPIEATHFGAVQAVPVVGASRLGVRVVRPLNASASEWLAQGGLAQVLGTWRTIDLFDTLTIVRDRAEMQLTAPAAVARSRLGGFLSGRDAIRIEPGIAPLFAVVTVVHELQHLLIEGARLDGAAPGLVDTGEELRLIDGNPWLAEGAAEWATEAILAPTRRTVPLLQYMEALKRGSIDIMTGGNDPHILGYLLVRGLATRASDSAQLRERLIRLLHDPVALAEEYHLRNRPHDGQPLRLTRPTGAGVIPEIEFTWDDGLAENLSRRLLIPAHPQEH